MKMPCRHSDDRARDAEDIKAEHRAAAIRDLAMHYRDTMTAGEAAERLTDAQCREMVTKVFDEMMLPNPAPGEVEQGLKDIADTYLRLAAERAAQEEMEATLN